MESYNPQRLISNNIWSLDQQDTPKEDADLWLIFKMFAIDFLFIKNEKKNICFAERKHNDNRFFF